MNRKPKTNTERPFRSIMETVEATGLSQHFIRAGVKSGSIPHVKSGSIYYVNLPAFMEQLNQQSKSQTEQ